MKHAYLIIAHNEFEVLIRLLKALDDKRNDIYIHFDKGVLDYPGYRVDHANLYIIENPVKVGWGGLSVVGAEYLLFEAALKQGPYLYYHLLSGVDMPLKSQNFIHSFFKSNRGKEFIGFHQSDISKVIDRNIRRYHIFPQHFRTKGGILDFSRGVLRYALLKFQYAFRIKRHRNIDFRKGTQWVSLTHDFVQYIISKKSEVMHVYQYTFCSDEIFLQTLCWNSSFRDNIFDPGDEGLGCMRMIGWKNNKLVDWDNEDFDILMNSDALFARKFNSKNMGVIDRILNRVTLHV